MLHSSLIVGVGPCGDALWVWKSRARPTRGLAGDPPPLTAHRARALRLPIGAPRAGRARRCGITGRSKRTHLSDARPGDHAELRPGTLNTRLRFAAPIAV